MPFILITFIGFISQGCLVCSQPTVMVEQGEILGKTEHFESNYLGIKQDVDVYLGIPYAEPPVGEKRFAAPLPKRSWGDDQIYDATFVRDICVQGAVPGYNQSEDCLHLNVFAPNTKPIDAAVMVFIHGGGLSSGNSYDLTGLGLSAIGDVIVVTINYRVAAFGFFVTGDEVSPGNYGFLDQAEALRWVQTNIHAFGGDPNKVTLFGQSAGGGCVSAHLFSPLSRDLFDKAIMQSGSMLFLTPDSVFLDVDWQREEAFKLGAAVGCTTTSTQELVTCMRDVDAQDLYQAALVTAHVAVPCVDYYFLLEPPVESLEKGDFKKCPLIDGFNKDEGTLWILLSELGLGNLDSPTAPLVSKETFEKELSGFLTAQNMYTNDLIEDSIKQEYVDWSKADDPDADYFDPWKYSTGDLSFSCPAILETKYHGMAAESTDHDVFQYFYTHVPSSSIFESIFPGIRWLGAGHGEELQFVFGLPLLYNYQEDEEKELSHNVIKYWSNFAKTGDPGKESESSTPYDDDRAWPAFTIPELQYKELAVNLTEGRGLRADECHLWNEYLKQITSFTADLVETEKQWREEFYTWKYSDMEDWRDAFKKYQETTNKLQ